MTTYTILSGEGEVQAQGLTLTEAAHEILTSDSREYDVRQDDDGGFTLWTRQQVANRGWEMTTFFSTNSDRKQAEDEIFTAIVLSPRFRGHCEAITDEAYAEMLAQGAEDEE
ncbi:MULTISPECIES: hypothetical protein [Sphingomonadales]|uniref:Uncharacterized protein n=1 Tax=Edaphosphingomonas haloaromaticamans TaxID=653954 RepID=A0A1S1HCE3_9SPHN|nr:MULTISPECIES: hypothetical protein [Sphingomonas]AGH48786.1 hypothetical protein G432_05295 [Sphingomonas sp. MM-1]OHT19889.1 hypothetical protein BHE75_01882 [Sphingomonas haloaromaticamans]